MRLHSSPSFASPRLLCHRVLLYVVLCITIGSFDSRSACICTTMCVVFAVLPVFVGQPFRWTPRGSCVRVTMTNENHYASSASNISSVLSNRSADTSETSSHCPTIVRRAIATRFSITIRQLFPAVMFARLYLRLGGWCERFAARVFFVSVVEKPSNGDNNAN